MVWPMIAAVGLGVASSAAGYASNRKAMKTSANRLERGDSYLEGARRTTQAGFQQARGYASDATGTLEQGVLDALASLDDGFAMEVRRVLEASAQGAARLDQDAVGRGLYGSTAAMSFQRALGQDTQRALAETTAAFSGRRANVALQGSQMVAGGLGNQANLEIARAGALSGIDAQRAGMWAGAPVPINNALSQGLGQLGGVAMQQYGINAANTRNDELIAAIREAGLS